jgi:anti-sigma B factor antagonist
LSLPQFEVAGHMVGARAVVRVSGELDIATVAQLCGAIDEAFQARPAELWIDLSALTFIDSSGLNTLLQTCDRLRPGTAIICPPGNVRRVFEIAGMVAILPLYDDVAAARSALESNGSTPARNSPQAV